MPAPIRGVAALATLALSRPWLYRLGTRLLPGFTRPLQRDGWFRALPYPISRWTSVRPLPAFTARFRQWWARRKPDDERLIREEHQNRKDRKV